LGSGPVRSLAERSRTRRPGIEKSDGGMEPERLLPERTRVVRFPDAPRSVGSSPLTRALRRSTTASDGGRPRPNQDGIRPGSGNPEALNASSAVSRRSWSTAKAARRAPARVRRSPERRSSATRPARQATPDQKAQGSARSGQSLARTPRDARRAWSAATSCARARARPGRPRAGAGGAAGGARRGRRHPGGGGGSSEEAWGGGGG